MEELSTSFAAKPVFIVIHLTHLINKNIDSQFVIFIGIFIVPQNVIITAANRLDRSFILSIETLTFVIGLLSHKFLAN